MLAPVVIFAYNRPAALQHLLTSLQACPESEQTTVIAFVDGPKTTEDEALAKHCVATFEASAQQFAHLEIHTSEVNRGLASTITEGVSDVMARWKAAIVLEDDLEVSPFFLQFMNEGLQGFRDRQDVWSLSGYTPSIALPDDYRHEVFLVPRAQCWGWASWADRWQSVDWHPLNSRNRLTPQERKRFDRGGNDLHRTLEMEAAGRIESWAVRWAYSAAQQKRWTVNPVRSLVQNMGFESSVAHRGWHDQRHRTPLSDAPGALYGDVQPDERIVASFKKHHDLGAISRIGYFLRRYDLGYHWLKRHL